MMYVLTERIEFDVHVHLFKTEEEAKAWRLSLVIEQLGPASKETRQMFFRSFIDAGPDAAVDSYLEGTFDWNVEIHSVRAKSPDVDEIYQHAKELSASYLNLSDL